MIKMIPVIVIPDFSNSTTTCLSPTTGTASQVFASALQFFTAAQCLIQDSWPPDANVQNGDRFDFIIVGAGSAGCVLANRLSEVKDWKILLIEAGHDPPVESTIPSQVTSLFNTHVDWGYKTSYNDITYQANKNGSINWPRGKMLGGSSSMNAMVYVRGNDGDYLRWFNAGNKEWHPSVVRKYFKKAESLQDINLLKYSKINKNYGHHGPLIINTFNASYRDLTLEILESWQAIGIKTVLDINTANVMGASISRVTAANGVRQSTAKTYLNLVKNRTNLKVLKYSFVTRVLLDSFTKRVYGVEVQRNGKKFKFYATREIILSAGTINNPQILMLSGVGPKKHLVSKKIKCIIDSPMVGQNLQDQLFVPVTIYGNESEETDASEQYLEAIKYLYNRSGQLAQTGFIDISAFYSSHNNATYPDYQNHLSIFNKKSTDIKNAYSNYKDEVIDYIVEKNKEYRLFQFLLVLLHPYSRGNISLNSNNPREHPIIHANYFKDNRDLEAAVTGIQILTEIVNTTFFRSIGGFLGRMKWAPCDKYKLNSDEYWACISLNFVSTTFNPVGTCKMGPDPRTSVVNSRLKVHGTVNLRVIDASIMPEITSGNTNGPTVMIGERGADLIKEDHIYTVGANRDVRHLFHDRLKYIIVFAFIFLQHLISV